MPAVPPAAPAPSQQPTTSTQLRSRAARGAVTLTLRNIGVRALGLVGMVVLARLLGPSEFGLLALGFTLVSFGHLIASGGLAAELIRREHPPAREELASVLGFQLLATLLIALVVLAVTALLGGTALVAGVMTLSLPLFVLRTPAIITLERDLRFGLMARAQLLEIFVYNVFAIGLVLAGAGVWGVAAAAALHPLVGSALLTAKGPSGVLRPRLDLAAIRPLLRFGVAFASVHFVIGLREQTVNVIVAAIAGTAALGVWSIAYRLLQVVFVLVQALWSVTFASMARLVQAREAPGALVERTLRVSAVAVGLLVSLIAGTAPALVPALFSEAWEEAVGVLPWGAAALMISAPISISMMGFLFAQGEAARVLGVTLADAAVWVAVAALLLPALGPEAAGIGMVAGALTLAVLMQRAARRHATVAVLRSMAGPLVAAAGATAAGWVLASQVSPPGVGLVVAAAAAAAAYLGVTLIVARGELLTLARVVTGALSRPGRARTGGAAPSAS